MDEESRLGDSTVSKGKHSKVDSEGTKQLQKAGKNSSGGQKVEVDNGKSDVSSVSPSGVISRINNE